MICSRDRFLVAFVVMVGLLASFVAGADVAGDVDAAYEDFLALYTHFHSNPELSLREVETGGRIADELEALGYDVTANVGGTGVVAVMTRGDGPTVMIRGDMDALPVKEETGLSYASEVVVKDDLGREVHVMHACGHDIHMTVLLGTARLLAAREDWAGTVMLVAQPAEERGLGAKAMLKDGLFERFPYPDFVISTHVDATLATGTVGYVPGYAMANVDSVDIKVLGRGGHGAYPHLTKDPVVVAARIVMGLQTIVSREIAATDPSVITVGSIHGGTKHNIIPNEVDLQLTVRSYSDATRDKLLAAIERTAVNEALAAGMPEDLIPIVEVKEEYTPALYNDPALVERITGVFREVFGEERVVPREPVMGGEDFGRYGRTEPTIPIFMFRLGTVAPERAAAHDAGEINLPSLHSSQFAPIPEPTIKTGVTAMTEAALALLGD